MDSRHRRRARRLLVVAISIASVPAYTLAVAALRALFSGA